MNVDYSKSSKSFWGRLLWSLIHTFGSNATTSKKARHYRMWMDSLSALLPCDTCINHLRENLLKRPLEEALKKGDSALRWSYDLHDDVNRQLKKISPVWKTVREYYRPSRTAKRAFHLDIVMNSLKLIAFSYKPETKSDMIRFFVLTINLIPSYDLKNLIHAFTKTYDMRIYLLTNEDMFYYTYMLDQYINKDIGNPILGIIDQKKFFKGKFDTSCKSCQV